MGDDADGTTTGLQVYQSVDGQLQRFLIQAAKAFIDKQGIKLNPCGTTSESASASASEAINDSPPDSVATGRVLPL